MLFKYLFEDNLVREKVARAEEDYKFE
jgi:hypothetical protein